MPGHWNKREQMSYSFWDEIDEAHDVLVEIGEYLKNNL